MFETIARVCALLLTVVFAWSFGAKVVRFRRWRRVLGRYGLGRLEPVASVGVPFAEAAVVTLFLFGRWRIGGALAITLVSAFSVAIARARATGGNRLPCGCFGGETAREAGELIARNALLGGLAAVVLLTRARPSETGGAAAVDVTLPAALVVVGALLIAWMTWQVTAALRRRA